jgi:acyl-CoA thioesterase FadM
VACSIVRLGRSSITWAVALFVRSRLTTSEGVAKLSLARGLESDNPLADVTDAAAAYGTMIHVYVDPVTGTSIDIPPEARQSLEKLVVR